jgi:hypothetical protein
MLSDAELHPGHHSIRLKHRDYRAPGDYFVTICARDKNCVFGRIAGGAVALSRLGQIVQECWMAIPDHFANVNLPALVTPGQAGAQHAAPLQRRIGDGID